MNMSKQQILETHKSYQTWLDSLKELSNEEAMSPYAPGKWSPNEIVMHLAEWDRFTYEERLPHMKEGARIERFPEFEKFNALAAELAKNHAFEVTIAHAKKERQRITERLEGINEKDWGKKFQIGEHTLSIEEYFTDFSEHDEHHKRQIESVRVR